MPGNVTTASIASMISAIRRSAAGGLSAAMNCQISSRSKPDFRMEIISDHETELASARGIALFAETRNHLVSGNRLHPAALKVIVTAVKHLPCANQFVNVRSGCIFNKVVCRASALGGYILEFLSVSAVKCTSILPDYEITRSGANWHHSIVNFIKLPSPLYFPHPHLTLYIQRFRVSSLHHPGHHS